LRGGKQRLTDYYHRTGLEVFARDGLTCMPMPFQPKSRDLAIEAQTKGGGVNFNVLQVCELKSAWNARKNGAI
jgi:hypothetical protein